MNKICNCRQEIGYAEDRVLYVHLVWCQFSFLYEKPFIGKVKDILADMFGTSKRGEIEAYHNKHDNEQDQRSI